MLYKWCMFPYENKILQMLNDLQQDNTFLDIVLYSSAVPWYTIPTCVTISALLSTIKNFVRYEYKLLP